MMSWCVCYATGINASTELRSMRYIFFVLFVGYACTACELPVNFTYFQKASGLYCRAPNRYLEAQYGGSFSVDTKGVARETDNPFVRFTVVEVRTWDELVARLDELDPGVSQGGAHTPSLFWDGRQDVYWHANAEEDTISTEFKHAVDTYITNCLVTDEYVGDEATTARPSAHEVQKGMKTDDTQTTPSGGDACSLEYNGSSAVEHAPMASAETTRVAPGNAFGQCFVFFFSRGCPHCAVVHDYINGNLRRKNVTFHYESYDVRSSDYSLHLIAGYNHFGWSGEKYTVPAIFIGDEENMTVLVGETAILNQLLPRIQELQSQPTKCYNFASLSKSSDSGIGVSNIHWGVLTAAALVDSINPCAIAVLLILLGGLVMSAIPVAPHAKQVHPEPSATSASLAHAPVQPECSGCDKEEADENEQDTTEAEKDLETPIASNSEENCSPTSNHFSAAAASISSAPEDLSPVGTSFDSDPESQPDADTIDSASEPGATTSSASAERKSRRLRAFFSGMAFILAIFIAYYALGFGIFTAVSSAQVSRNILLVLGVFVIALGLWNVKDFLCYKRGYNIEIPRSWRPLLKRILGAVTSPLGAFMAGFIVCLFELPCTGGPYLFILGLLAAKNTRTEAAFLLLYYNFIFVLPLIIINCLVFWATSWLDKVGSWKEKYIRYLHLFAGLVLIALGVLAVVDSQHPLF